MKRGNNDSDLLNAHVPEQYIPFYQVWTELVDRRTLEEYRYPILTSLSALAELDSVIVKTLSGLFNNDANINACRDETLYILKEDKLLGKHFKPIQNQLLAAVAASSKDKADKERLLHRIRYAIKAIAPSYLKLALSELKAGIASGNLGEISEYAGIVASQAIYNGWSARGLSDLLGLFKQDKDPEELWEDFAKKIRSAGLPQHDVLINIPFKGQGPAGQEATFSALRNLGLSIKNRADIIAEFSNIADIGQLIAPEKRYFHVVVKAKDIYAAAHDAITNISEQLNLASFYNLVSAWDLKSVVIVAINSQSTFHRAFTAKDLYEAHEYIDSSGKIFQDTCQIFKDKKMTVIRDKLQGAFGYTNISRASLFQEEKYMNLWVALESLARTDMYSDIISNVKETVPAAVTLRYIYRIVRNYVEDCRRCGVCFEFSNRTVDMEQEKKEKMVRETIAVFQNGTSFAELQARCAVNSLLLHRTAEISELLASSAAIRSKIENRYRRINWQIQRLYRIRNEIAHAALREHASLVVYIEYLHDYLSTYISEIVTCLRKKKLSSIEEALCQIRDNYNVFIALSQDPREPLVAEGVLKTGIIDLL